MSSQPCDAEAHRQLVRRLNSPTFVVRGNSVIEANDAALKLVGAATNELEHLRFDEMFVDSRAPEQLRDALANSSRSALHAQLRLRSVDGVEQEVSATVTPCAGELAPASMHVIVTQSMIVSLGGNEIDSPYARMFESTGNAMFVLDPQTLVILGANRGASEMYRLDADAFAGRPLAAIVGDSNAALFAGASSPVEFEVARDDGSSMYLETTLREITYRGRPAILAVQRDASDRRQMQTALQEIEKRFDLFVNSVTEYAMIVLDRNGRIESWNSGADRLTGYVASEAVGKPFSIFYTAEDVKAGRPKEDLAAATQDGEVHYDAWQLRKDLSPFYGTVLLAPLRSEDGTVVGFVRIVRDSTDRLRLEQEHAALNATLELIAREWVGTFDAIDSAVVLVDDELAFRRLNTTAQQLAGLQFAEVLQRKLDDFPSEPWMTATTLAGAAIRTGRVESADTADARNSWHIDASLAYLDEMSRRIVIVIRDTTETRRLEESLRQSQLASALGTMIAGVAHEVRRPLFQLSSTIDACIARMGENSDFQRYVPHFKSSIAALNGIIHELLDYTRPQPLTIAAHAPATILRDAAAQCAPLAAARNVTIRVDDSNTPESASFDSARMTQVLQNLIENAVQHSPSGGMVNAIARTAQSGGVEFVVEDEGKGFTADDLDQAVQPFYTRRSGGTGLGLAIVKKIVDGHGASLTLANRPAGGAIVTITIASASSPVPA